MPLFLLLLLLTISAHAKVDFASEIQPILSGNCYACHGPDTSNNKAKLRLDQRKLALKGGDTSPAIVPGNPAKSLIIQRINLASDHDDHMPPSHKKAPLTATQKDLLTRWIEEGAAWGKHWAFIPPVRPPLPKTKNTSWSQNPIDHFILARLESQNLSPSQPAAPRTLLRRLHLDLVGLPPSPNELQTFQPSDLNSQISTLLSSPHFGEKWSRDWLDVARYADSSGYEKDLPRQMHFYRDWVVNSLNSDMSYQDFIIKQIAGDLLPNATKQDIIATGYLRNSMTNEEGGIKPEQFRVEGIFDRVDAVGKGILGLTTQCAQCHTHKYDPLTHDEYYGIFGYLNSIRESSIAVYPNPDEEKVTRIKNTLTTIESRLKSQHPDWQNDFQKWQEELLALPRTKWVVQRISQIGDSGQKYQNLPDHSLINQGFASTRGSVPFDHQTTTLETVRSVRLELLNDPYLALGGPGRSNAGTFALTEFKLQHGPPNGKLQDLSFTKATASVNPPNHGPANQITGHAAYAVDQDQKTAWTNDLGPGRSNAPQTLTLELAKPLQNAEALRFRTTLIQNHGGSSPNNSSSLNLGRFRLSFSESLPNALDHLPPLILEALFAKNRTPKQKQTLFRHWRSQDPKFASFNSEIEALWKTHPKPAVSLVAQAVATPRVTRLLERGEQTKPRHEVKPHVPAFLHALPKGDPQSRLTFARWLVDRNSPTAARTVVNRIWQSYFGTGLLETPEDLGLQSPRPSHPELLDWLAVELMDNDWSMKHIHRLIVSSATYQQDSTHTSLLRDRDPNNRLIARGPRHRLSGETLRDLHLSASGLLNLELGGRAVYPPAPAFLFQRPASFGVKYWPTEIDAQRYRRALYTFRFRSVPYPMLAVFDAPTGESSCVRRSTSTTPLQALTTLNETLSVEIAVALGIRILEHSISEAFEHCTSRKPLPNELQILEALFTQQKKTFTPETAKELLTTYHPVTLPPSNHDPVELAAATSVAQALLNLDETMTKN